MLRRYHQWGELLSFLEQPEVEPTNNRVEQVLRPAVIARKVSQCSKTLSGADAFVTFTTVHPDPLEERVTALRGRSTGRPFPHPKKSDYYCLPDRKPVADQVQFSLLLLFFIGLCIRLVTVGRVNRRMPVASPIEVQDDAGLPGFC
jgi:hypothetical protein